MYLYVMGENANPWGIRSCNNYALTFYFPTRVQRCRPRMTPVPFCDASCLVQESVIQEILSSGFIKSAKYFASFDPPPVRTQVSRLKLERFILNELQILVSNSNSKNTLHRSLVDVTLLQRSHL